MSSTPTAQKISAEQSWQVFDAATQRLLKMSGDELIRQWDGGELVGNTAPELMRVLMLQPSGR
jgi:hypothetical protein